ncbi:Uncharacterized protein OS=Haliangium ochraceum (strain DSM 14365 / JCM 11303 / SMP-2) GN=Hoch_5775 PE=4 SV=1 [Gemmata massiliana]|uniref:Uncharacterized protein n=1 Tax=Gemmata massiliana TaxID=1210884 RepID=A0A6P2D4X6_9BACT|nr:hypothetical protein [Gemmata massiliana]VTR96113.1 Uncharacterized protein OS=Haliangium ochraceum (strain DSM 14365 / JCM 11303 / SMP-2) GN=Hoch_5775 PE=4 SV=1 [Gemmata massiliana]
MRCATYSLAAIFVLAGGARAEDKPVVVKLIKLSAPAPADWKSEKPSNRLRTYQFKLPGAKDHPDAELSIMNESLPGTDKNFPKWKATFVPPEGKTVDDISKTAKWEVPGATVNVLDVTGTWKYKERPLDKKETLLEDWRVIWVIVEEKDETHHIRLSGPSVTVAEHAKALEKWVKSLR